MKDIKQQIEQEAIKYSINMNMDNLKETKMLCKIFQDGANFILSKWQEANRWRSVEKESPEVGTNIITRKKTKYGIHYGTFTDIPQHIIDIAANAWDEWKLIDSIEE